MPLESSWNMIVARTRQSLGDLIACLTGEARSPNDWRRLVALASETLTIGSLADALLAGKAEVDLPEDVRALLADVRKRARKRNRLLIHQFRELLAPLNSIGVQPIVMRGMARLLSSSREHSRLLSDIDLLVPIDRRSDCAAALAGLGYEIAVKSDDPALSLVFARGRDVGTVDLHTQLKPPYLKLGYSEIARHCRPAELRDGAALLPNPTCQLALSVLHDQLHDRDYWRGLVDVRHLIDLHRLAGEGVDWERLARFFESPTSKRAFKVQMLTARSLLNIPIPDAYCDGAWARLQVLRRRVQARFPGARPILTLLTIALDPPRLSAAVEAPEFARRNSRFGKLRERLERYIWRPYPGKL